MKIPNSDRAIIESSKITEYFLNAEHQRGGVKEDNMDFTLYSDVILMQNLPAEGLSIGDIGVVVEKHEIAGMETGYSVEFFEMLGSTVALMTLPTGCFRSPSRTDRPTVRPMATAG